MARDLGSYGEDYRITETYSPPKVTDMAERLGMILGLAPDLSNYTRPGGRIAVGFQCAKKIKKWLSRCSEIREHHWV